MPYVNTSPLQSFTLRVESHVIIASFISDSHLSIYGLGQKIYMLKNEMSWCINQYVNTFTNGT